jgi:hypothetical protein
MYTPTPLPCPPLSGSVKDSFAFKTLTRRVPTILAKAVDDVTRTNFSLNAESDSDILEAKREEAKRLVNEIGLIRYELVRDKPIPPIEDDPATPDPALRAAPHELDWWNQQINVTPPLTYLGTSWLFSECYVYRRLRSCFNRTKYWQHYDPFARQKNDSLVHSAPAIDALVGRLHTYLETTYEDSVPDNSSLQKTLFLDLLLISLWGNRTDLSLLPNLSEDETAQLQAARRAEDTDHHTLVNDAAAVWNLVQSWHKVRVDIILDNAGFELFCDLLLADWLVQSGRAQTVYLHGKCIPWFVSDVMPADVTITLDLLEQHEAFTKLANANALKGMVARWRQHIATGRWQCIADPFWTSPYAFWDLPTIAPELWHSLCQSALCIYKGDLNYRKLVYDCTWPTETAFSTAIGPLYTTPGAPPLLALRTCKADVVVGLAPGQAEKLTKQCPDWCVNGEFAVIQFAQP